MKLSTFISGLLMCGTSAASVAASALKETRPLCWSKTKNLLVFGDSYTFIQGTSGRTNFSFIGDGLTPSYSPSTLLQNKIVPNATSAGGPNWVQYLTGCFSGRPNDCGKGKAGKGVKRLWDFAFAGADVSTKFLTLHHNYTIDLVDQLDQYEKYAHRALSLPPSSTLVTVFIGINDINDSARWTNLTASGGFPAFYAQLAAELFGPAGLGRLHALGFRHFLLLGLPPLHRTPANQVAATPLPSKGMVDAFDSAVRGEMRTFVERGRRSGVTTRWVDTGKALEKVLDSPERWGVTNTTGFCRAYDQPGIGTEYEAYGCRPIGEYFWYSECSCLVRREGDGGEGEGVLTGAGGRFGAYHVHGAQSDRGGGAGGGGGVLMERP
ncbi:lysophospholipase A [Geopyxis carbonaria]|nr:lysophospholipase A [Geopyxis carbonaria]